MAHYAKIENDIVTMVIVAEQNFIDKIDGEWIQTSYNASGGIHKLGGTPMRKNYAGVGYIYDRVNDCFYSPRIFPSWNLNTETYLWEAPVPYPVDGLINCYDNISQNYTKINNN